MIRLGPVNLELTTFLLHTDNSLSELEYFSLSLSIRYLLSPRVCRLAFTTLAQMAGFCHFN